MRVIVQRVKQAHVEVDQVIVGQIDHGYLMYVGIHVDDTEDMVVKCAHKIHQLRIFEAL